MKYTDLTETMLTGLPDVSMLVSAEQDKSCRQYLQFHTYQKSST